jgi:hypothetical protein
VTPSSPFSDAPRISAEASHAENVPPALRFSATPPPCKGGAENRERGTAVGGDGYSATRPAEHSGAENLPADRPLAVLRVSEDGDAELRASLSRWQGRDLVQLRWWEAQSDGTWKASGRGVALRPCDLEPAREALAKAATALARPDSQAARAL